MERFKFVLRHFKYKSLLFKISIIFGQYPCMLEAYKMYNFLIGNIGLIKINSECILFIYQVQPHRVFGFTFNIYLFICEIAIENITFGCACAGQWNPYTPSSAKLIILLLGVGILLENPGALEYVPVLLLITARAPKIQLNRGNLDGGASARFIFCLAPRFVFILRPVK